MSTKFNSVCNKSNHKSKPVEILCFNEKCRNDPLMCLKCLQPHRGHLLESLENLIEAFEKYISGIDKNAETITINKVKDMFSSVVYSRTNAR